MSQEVEKKVSVDYIGFCDRDITHLLTINSAAERGTMPFSVAFALLILAVVLITFLVVRRVRGPWFALAASFLAFVGMFALFVAVVTLITWGMG